MSYLRFSPVEYRALCKACGPLPADEFRPRALQRLLVSSLQEAQPTLAARIGQLRIRELSTLCEHLRPAGPKLRCELTARELSRLAEAFGPMLRMTRFSHRLRRPLVRHLLPESPALASKLDSLSDEEFRQLCERLRACIADGL